MDDSANPIPSHERFGYDVVKRAFDGESLKAWESDYARLFWQSLEIHNGGFAQWIGNTGRDGVLETLEILDRHGFVESWRVSQLAIELVKFDSWPDGQSMYDFLESNVENWFERLRPLDEAYWDDADAFDEKLRQVYEANTG